MCLIFGCDGSSLATCGISLDAVNGATFHCSAWTSQIFSLAVGFLTTGLEVHHQQFFFLPHIPPAHGTVRRLKIFTSY